MPNPLGGYARARSSRPLDLRTANPAMAAVAGYKEVDAIFDKNEDRKIAALDRERRVSSEDAAEGRAVSQEERAGDTFARQQTEWADEDTVKAGRAVQLKQSALDEQLVGVSDPAERDSLVDQFVETLSPEDQAFYRKAMQNSSNMKTPEDRKKVREETANFHVAFAEMDEKKMLKAVNFLEKDRINTGEARPGVTVTDKEAVGVEFNKDGQAVVKIKITGKDEDGKDVNYEDYMTVGRSGDPNDPVKLLNPEAVASSMDKYNVLSVIGDRVEARMAGAGDQEAYNSLLKKRKGRALNKATKAALKGVTADMDNIKALETISGNTDDPEAVGKAYKAHLDAQKGALEGRKLDLEKKKLSAAEKKAVGSDNALKAKDIIADIESANSRLAGMQTGENMSVGVLSSTNPELVKSQTEGKAKMQSSIDNGYRALYAISPAIVKTRYPELFDKGGIFADPEIGDQVKERGTGKILYVQDKDGTLGPNKPQ